MAQQITPDKTFGKKCFVKGKGEVKYWIVRKGGKQTRVYPTNATEAGEGELVKSSDIYNEEDFTPPSEETTTTEAPASEEVAAPVAETPVEAAEPQ